jgi:hypothetical protein
MKRLIRDNREDHMIVPGWADLLRQIESPNPDKEVVVLGKGFHWSPQPKEPERSNNPRDFLAGFDVDRVQKRPFRRSLPIVEFVDATSPQLQERFVVKHGPVFARWETRPRGNALIAYQDREILAAEQRIFSNLFFLQNAIVDLDAWARGTLHDGKGGIEAENVYCDGYDVKYWDETDWRKFLRQNHYPEDPSPERFDCLAEAMQGAAVAIRDYPRTPEFEKDPSFPWKQGMTSLFLDPRLSNSTLYIFGNMFLCEVLNCFPHKLVFGGLYVDELPSPDYTGVRSLLYYMLRMDYLQGRKYRMCARPTCSKWFIHDRSDHIYHDHTCKNAANAVAHRLKEELKR